MKDKRRELMDYAMYDYTGIQQRLTRRAAEGWRLEKVNTGLGIWTYRRAEPAKVRYEVTYAPSGSEFNPRPTDDEEALTDLCAQAGWYKVASLAQMHIYCNEDPDAVPLETDDSTRLSTIHAAMKKNLLPSYIVQAVMWTVLAGLHWSTVFLNPINILTTGITVLNLAMTAWLVIMSWTNLLDYCLWHRRAKKAVAQGQPLPEAAFYRKFRLVIWASIVLMLAGLLSQFGGTSALWYTAGYLAVLILALGIRDTIKAEGRSAWFNRAVTFAVILVGIMLVNGIITGITVGVNRSGRDRDGAVPMTVSDLAPVGEVHELTLEDQSSILASYGRYDICEDRFDANGRREEDALQLQYEVVDAKLDLLMPLFREEMEEEFAANIYPDENGIVQADPAPWGAEWALYYSELTGGEGWLIGWDGRILDLRASWNLTPEQIAAAAEIWAQ